MKWLVPLHESNDAQIRLICFPFAGGGVDTFREWSRHLGTEIEIFSVLLPGRGVNFGSELVRECDVVTREVCKAISGKKATKTVFFGHSLGSLIAYNTVLEMHRYANDSQVVAMMLSACNPPGVVSDDDSDIRWKTDDKALIEKIFNLGGLPAEVAENAQLLDLVKPILRSDLLLVDNARRVALTRYHGSMPNIPIVAMGGDQDPKVDIKDLDLWSNFTSANFSRKTFSGGHFYLSDQASSVCSFINETILSLEN